MGSPDVAALLLDLARLLRFVCACNTTLWDIQGGAAVVCKRQTYAARDPLDPCLLAEAARGDVISVVVQQGQVAQLLKAYATPDDSLLLQVLVPSTTHLPQRQQPTK